MKQTALSSRILYRPPYVASSIVAVSLMWILLHMSILESDGTGNLIISFPQRTTSHPYLTSIRDVYYHRVLQGFFQLGILMFRSHSVIRLVCVGAWVAHMVEALYATRVLVVRNCSTPVMAWYVVMTFLCGFPQLGPLLQEVRRVGASKTR